MKTLSAFSALSVLALTLVTACGHDAPPPSAPPPPPPVAPATTILRPATVGKTNSTIYLSDALRKQCGIETIESTKEAPKFAFDESMVNSDDRDVLAKVAECLTAGQLKGKSVKLIGRADARGTTEYNMALGARRANAVLKYLGNLGVPAAQLSETSRGELDATGAGEEGYRRDRRVDIDVL